MIHTNKADYHNHLPPYRSLLNPNARYDYQLHSLIPISQNELNNLRLNHLKLKQQSSSSSFKMKYKSLLNDVNKKISKISSSSSSPSSNSNSNGTANTTGTNSGAIATGPVEFVALPIEIQYHMMSMLSFEDLKSLLMLNKHFYKLLKQFLYNHLKFNSSYRFAQFISILRFNPKLGYLVKSIDLSDIKPCNYELIKELEEKDQDQVDDQADNANLLVPHENNQLVTYNQPSPVPSRSSIDSDLEAELDESKIRAGWRDWKFMKNPLYVNNLSKINSNYSQSQVSLNSMNSNNKKRLSFSFLKRKRSKNNQSNHRHNGSYSSSNPHSHSHSHSHGRHLLNQNHTYSLNSRRLLTDRSKSSHPPINKFLLNYSDTKDVPIGYILHLINLCPNLTSINMGNLSLSMDYEINRNFIYKFITFDTTNNFSKSLLMTLNDIDDSQSIYNFHMADCGNDDTFSLLSTRSSVQSINSASANPPSVSGSNGDRVRKPIWKYNSLLSPPPKINCLNNSDGKLYLSDLNLKAINPKFLTRLNEKSILDSIIKLHKYDIDFTYLNLSSMIWLNKTLVKNFLSRFLIPSYLNGDLTNLFMSRNLVIDLTNSGMYKDLTWAKLIDLNNENGFNLVIDILNDDLLSDFERRLRDDRLRRGRIAENYLH